MVKSNHTARTAPAPLVKLTRAARALRFSVEARGQARRGGIAGALRLYIEIGSEPRTPVEKSAEIVTLRRDGAAVAAPERNAWGAPADWQEQGIGTSF